MGLLNHRNNNFRIHCMSESVSEIWKRSEAPKSFKILEYSLIEYSLIGV